MLEYILLAIGILVSVFLSFYIGFCIGVQHQQKKLVKDLSSTEGYDDSQELAHAVSNIVGIRVAGTKSLSPSTVTQWLRELQLLRYMN